MKNILIVDPSETFLCYLRRIISRMGYATQIARDVPAGVALARHSVPALIITELHFPERDGLYLLAEICGSVATANIPVVCVSTDGTAESEQRARQAGCVDYLTKPVTVRDIHSMLQRSMPFTMKRKIPRIHAELSVVLRVAGRQIDTKTSMLSAGGMLVVATHEDLQVGHQIDLALTLPSVPAAMSLRGEIVYLVPRAESSSLSGIGIKFISLESEYVNSLTEYIEETLSNPWSPS